MINRIPFFFKDPVDEPELDLKVHDMLKLQQLSLNLDQEKVSITK